MNKTVNNPIGVGWKKYAGGEKTEQAISGCYTLYYVLSGTYAVNHIDYYAAAGDMIVCAIMLNIIGKTW